MKDFKTVIDEKGIGLRVDQFLAQELEISRALVKKFKEKLFVNDINVKLNYKLKQEDVITFSYEIEIQELNIEAEDIDVPIVYEDESLLVANKPFGMVVHPAKGNWSGTLVNALYSHLQKSSDKDIRPGVVHRLDKETSGLIVMAKNILVQEKLSALFKNREVKKVYYALVEGYLRKVKDYIDLSLGRHPKNRLKYAVDPLRGKDALTEYELVKEYEKASLLRVQIHTGRTHQIRVHLAHIGNPVIGDKLYSRRYANKRMCLLARELSFIHPITKEEMKFKVDIPEYFNRVIQFFDKKQ